MFRTHVECSCAGMVVMVVFLSGVHVLSDTRDNEGAAKVQAVLEANSPRALQTTYKDLFGEISSQKLDELVSHKNDALAIAAAWQRVRRTVPREDFDEVRPDVRALHRFIGLVEGRVIVNLPHWWERAIFEAGAHGRGNIWFPLSEDAFDAGFQRYPEDGFGWTRWDTDVRIEGDRWLIRQGDDSVLVGHDLAQPLRRPDAVAVAFDEERAFLGIQGLYGGGQVFCFSRETGELIWKQELHGGFGGGTTGRHYLLTEARASDGRLIIFGIGTVTRARVDVLNAETGKVHVRFETVNFGDW